MEYVYSVPLLKMQICRLNWLTLPSGDAASTIAFCNLWFVRVHTKFAIFVNLFRDKHAFVLL